MIKIVAVTGASGFLGRQLVTDLVNRNYQVRCLIREKSKAFFKENDNLRLFQVDWSSLESIKTALKGVHIVVHSAAIHPERGIGNSREIMEFNVNGTRRLLENLDNVERFILVSSMRALINKTSDGIFDENSNYDFQKYDTPYGYSKFLSQQICFDFFRKKKLPLLVVNPTPIIGPLDLGPSPNGKFILEFIKTKIVFTLKCSYGFVDVRDVSSAIELLFRHGVFGENYLLCSANWPLKEFIEKIHCLIGIKKPIIEIPLPIAYCLGMIFDLLVLIKPGMTLPVTRSTVEFAALNPVFNGEKIKKLGFSYINPNKTLKDSLDWLINNYGNLQK